MPEPAALPPDHPHCLNCGAELRGQYCGDCGQRARNRLISLWELIQDAFGDLLELDSRLWRTVIPLLIRPGQLTLDYLQGKRARYMPPFRMYLVLSVIFFVVAFFDPREDLSLLFEPEPETPPEAATAESDEAKVDEAGEVLDRLEAEGIITSEQASRARQAEAAGKKDGVHVNILDVTDDDGFNFQIDEETGECTFTGIERLPPWLQRRLTKERLEGTCERIGADNGKTLGALILDNVPVALIVLLPLMALVFKSLYPLSRRYFVEHLLFFIHYHSFFFLILTLQILFARLASLVGLPQGLYVTILVAASFYIPVYLYKAMRHVYGQGHVLTTLKFLVLLFAYWVGLALTMIGALTFAILAV